MNEPKSRFVGTGKINNQLEKQKQTVQGVLTSRIETRNIIHSFGKVFYYGFFKLNDQEQEIPVIFKGDKPDLIKGSQIQLTGQWANSNNSRLSFTCLSYEIKPNYQAKEACRG